MGIDIHPLYLLSVIALWIIAYHITFGLVAIARDPSLVFWSVGPFGVSVVSLRQPPAGRIFTQLVIASSVLALLCYTNLFIITPPPITGLSSSPFERLALVATPVLVITLVRLYGILRERRYHLWGEARVLDSARRSLALGARIHFTPVGRTFLRERFGAEPQEFLSMVR